MSFLKNLDPRKIGKNLNPKNKFGQLKREIKEEILDELKNELKDVAKTPEELVKKGLESIVREGTKIIEQKISFLFRTAIPDGTGVKLGKVSFDFKIDEKRMEEIIRLIKNGIHSKRDALNLIKAASPEKVSIELSASLPIVEIGIGVYPWWHTDKFLKIADRII